MEMGGDAVLMNTAIARPRNRSAAVELARVEAREAGSRICAPCGRSVRDDGIGDVAEGV
jgi:thiazole synthase ThiGH ThiG subunit